MLFDNFVNRPHAVPEKIDETVLVERLGVRSTKARVEDMMLAGKKLQIARAIQFDFSDGQELIEDYYDVTRNKDFDFADADAYLKELNHRFILKQKANAEKIAQQKSNQKVENVQSELTEE